MEENKNTTVENNETNVDEGTGKVDTQATEKNEGEEKKYSQEEAQKMADAIVAKKLKGMPSKEEIKAFNEWKESQKTEEQKKADAEAENTRKEKELSDTKKELAVYKAGVSADEADFVVFKVSKMDGDFEENLENFLKDNPKYLKNAETNNNQQQQTTGVHTQKMEQKGANGVASILKNKYPNLYK